MKVPIVMVCLQSLGSPKGNAGVEDINPRTDRTMSH